MNYALCIDKVRVVSGKKLKGEEPRDFGNDSFYKCPSCRKKMYKVNYISYTVFNSKDYSDGFTTGLPDLTHNLAKCPHCDTFVFLTSLKETEIERYSKADKDDWHKRKKLKEPELDDLITAEKNQLAKNSKEELDLRTALWQKLNYKVYKLGKNLTKKETALWEKNCKALLDLYIQKLAENNKDDDTDTLYITIAELYRNIGNFDECKKTLKKLPAYYDWLKKQYIKQCKEENRMVFEIKPRKESKKSNEKYIEI